MFPKLYTTLQSLMNTKLSLHRFWSCHENGLIKTIHTIPHNLYVRVKLTSLYCGLRIILILSKGKLTEFGIHYRLESCGLEVPP